MDSKNSFQAQKLLKPGKDACRNHDPGTRNTHKTWSGQSRAVYRRERRSVQASRYIHGMTISQRNNYMMRNTIGVSKIILNILALELPLVDKPIYT